MLLTVVGNRSPWTPILTKSPSVWCFLRFGFSEIAPFLRALRELFCTEAPTVETRLAGFQTLNQLPRSS